MITNKNEIIRALVDRLEAVQDLSSGCNAPGTHPVAGRELGV